MSNFQAVFQYRYPNKIYIFADSIIGGGTAIFDLDPDIVGRYDLFYL
jgi:hypothetical protein